MPADGESVTVVSRDLGTLTYRVGDRIQYHMPSGETRWYAVVGTETKGGETRLLIGHSPTDTLVIAPDRLHRVSSEALVQARGRLQSLGERMVAQSETFARAVRGRYPRWRKGRPLSMREVVDHGLGALCTAHEFSCMRTLGEMEALRAACDVTTDYPMFDHERASL